ncbi:MAG: class II aldolase/adducin family protein [Oscillospiraceae bacterium]|nr:class II aldolase/adducin family protein [Oscillospiraceae bacterium]
MKFELLHPADQIVLMMDRIYQGGMTTTSGGNLSVLDENGDIWITPTGVDKGALTRGDICRVKSDGQILGPHKPSVELPFHATIYKRRPDLRAVLHAHPPALVAFSVARVLPDTRLVTNTFRTLGDITMAPYAVPGSQELGDNIASEFEKGFTVVVMENHGVVLGAENLFQAFMKFETLESAANLEIYARKLGAPKSLRDSETNLTDTRDHLIMDDFTPNRHSPEECAARRDMTVLIRRSYCQGLFGSTQGTYSVRLSDGSFLITPYGVDRAYMDEGDLVLIKNGMKEQGKIPSRSVKMHQLVYEKHRDINSVLGANPPHAMAFAVTEAEFDPRTIPESYIMLRQIQKVPFSAIYLKPEMVADMFSAKTSALICENNQILVTGNSLLNAFDRLEVAEATAHSVISAIDIGPLVHISEAEVEDINMAFNLK